MSTIYLVRHGQASFGAASYDQLSAKGEQQAQVVGDFFKQTLKQTPLVVAGSMQRHQQTAQLALSQSFHNASIQTESAWNGAIDRWIGAQYDHEYHETWLGFQSRVEQALQSLCESIDLTKHRQAVVFSSGGVISVAVGKVLGLNAKQIFALNWSIANASITTLRWTDGRLQLLSFNEHHYLKTRDAELLTWI